MHILTKYYNHQEQKLKEKITRLRILKKKRKIKMNNNNTIIINNNNNNNSNKMVTIIVMKEAEFVPF